MRYEEDLRGIDEEIEREYDELVVRKYRPIFSRVVEENAEKLRKGHISSIEICKNEFLVSKLFFLKEAFFMKEDKYIYPRKTEEESLNGLIEIAKTYKNVYDYDISLQCALKFCMDDLTKKVGEAVWKQRILYQEKFGND